MYSKTATTKSISSYWDNSQIRRSVEKVKRKMESADAILIVMSTIVSRKQVLISTDYFIHREIMDYGNVQNLVTIKLMIMNP